MLNLLSELAGLSGGSGGAGGYAPHLVINVFHVSNWQVCSIVTWVCLSPPTCSVPCAVVLAMILVCVCYLMVNIAYIAVLAPEEIAGLSAGGEAIALVRGTMELVRRDLVLVYVRAQRL